MDFSGYTATLIKTLLSQWELFAIIAPLFLIEEITYMRSKKKMSKKENKDRQQLSTIMVLAFIGITIMCVVRTTPIIIDLVGEHYISEHGEYSIHTAPRSRSTADTEWVVLTTDSGDEVVLHYLWSEALSELPDDTCYGTVWYSENSHYILDFIPDESADNSPAE